VILTADHGEAFEEHGENEHGYSLHREELEVPLILRYPTHIPKGRRVMSLASTIDVYPTVAALMGFSVDRHLEGESLLPLIRRDAWGWERSVFSELPQQEQHPPSGTLVALQDERYKLILRLEDNRRLLYDTRSDPDERTDLSTDQPDRVHAMERAIRLFLKQRRGRLAPPIPLTPTEKRLLRSLGYLSGTKP